MKRFIQSTELVLALLMGSIVVMVIGEVVMRYFAGSSLIIAEEYSRYMMIWVAWLGIALLAYEDTHIRISLLTDSLPGRSNTVLKLLEHLIVAFFAAAIIYATYRLMPSLQNQRAITLPVEMKVFYAAIPVGCGFLVAISAARFIRTLAGLFRSRADVRNINASRTETVEEN